MNLYSKKQFQRYLQNIQIKLSVIRNNINDNEWHNCNHTDYDRGFHYGVMAGLKYARKTISEDFQDYDMLEHILNQYKDRDVEKLKSKLNNKK